MTEQTNPWAEAAERLAAEIGAVDIVRSLAAGRSDEALDTISSLDVDEARRLVGAFALMVSQRLLPVVFDDVDQVCNVMSNSLGDALEDAEKRRARWARVMEVAGRAGAWFAADAEMITDVDGWPIGVGESIPCQRGGYAISASEADHLRIPHDTEGVVIFGKDETK